MLELFTRALFTGQIGLKAVAQIDCVKKAHVGKKMFFKSKKTSFYSYPSLIISPVQK